MSLHHSLCRFAALLISLAIAWPAQAIVNGAPPAVADTRFDAVAAFGRASWLGAGSAPLFEHEWHCTVTLVTEDIIFGANHCIDDHLSASDFLVRFRRRPDGGLGTLAGGVDSYFHVPLAAWLFRRGDFFAARLAEPVSHIAPIPVSIYGVHSLADEPFWQAGWGKEGPDFNTGPRRQLMLCENRIHSSDYLHTFATAWNVSGNGCGVNMNDSGSPQLLEDTEGGALRIIGVTSTLSQGVNLHFFDANPEIGLKHENWTSADAAVEKVRVVPLYVEPGATFQSVAFLANAGVGAVPAGANIRAQFFGNAQGWSNGRTFFDGTTDAELGPLRYPISETHQVAHDAPIGSYFVRWSFADNLAFGERFPRNNFAYSPYISVAPRFPSSRENYVGYWRDDDHPDFPGNGLFLLHRRTDQSVVFATMNRATGELHLRTRVLLNAEEGIEIEMISGDTFAGTQSVSDDPRYRDRWELQAQDSGATLVAEKMSTPYLSGFAAGVYRGRIDSPAGGRLLVFMTTEQQAAFVFQSEDARGIAYANFNTTDWSFVSVMATNVGFDSSVASLVAQLEWQDDNDEWLLSGEVATRGGNDYAFSARIEWEAPSPRTWFETCENDWQCEDGMGQDALCKTDLGPSTSAFCSAVCDAASDCEEGSCWFAGGFCVPNCQASNECPDGFRCQQNLCVGTENESETPDAGVLSDGGDERLDAGFIQEDGGGLVADAGYMADAGERGPDGGVSYVEMDGGAQDATHTLWPATDGGAPDDASQPNDGGMARPILPSGTGCGSCDAGGGKEGMTSLLMIALFGGVRRRRNFGA